MDKEKADEAVPMGPGKREVVRSNRETVIVKVTTPMSDGTERESVRVEGPFHVG